MNPAFQRGILLYRQGRYDLADREFRTDLAADPGNPVSHAFLALCLAERGEPAGALAEADEAVGADPGLAFAHYVRGRVLSKADRDAEAEASVNEAIRIDPDDADFLALLANIKFARKRWAEALEAADRGLAADPENAGCLNLRAMALVQLGRKDEAAKTLGAALADDPENALTHANQGWALLHRGDHAQALVHFREALRLDPDLEWARAGIVEALKARHWLYRRMLAFFLWMGRQGQVAQWAVILGFVFGRKLLADLARARPEFKPYVIPILVVSFAFLMLTWISSPLFNLLLRFNTFGRLALSPGQKRESTLVGGCFLTALASFAAYLATRWTAALLFTAYFGFLVIPLAVVFRLDPGRPRLLGAAYAVALGLLGLPFLSLALLGAASPFAGRQERAFEYFQYFIGGSVLSTWVPTLLRSRFE